MLLSKYKAADSFPLSAESIKWCSVAFTLDSISHLAQEAILRVMDPDNTIMGLHVSSLSGSLQFFL